MQVGSREIITVLTGTVSNLGHHQDLLQNSPGKCRPVLSSAPASREIGGCFSILFPRFSPCARPLLFFLFFSLQLFVLREKKKTGRIVPNSSIFCRTILYLWPICFWASGINKLACGYNLFLWASLARHNPASLLYALVSAANESKVRHLSQGWYFFFVVVCIENI